MYRSLLITTVTAALVVTPAWAQDNKSIVRGMLNGYFATCLKKTSPQYEAGVIARSGLGAPDDKLDDSDLLKSQTVVLQTVTNLGKAQGCRMIHDDLARDFGVKF